MQHLIRCIVVGVVGRTTAFIVVTTSLLNFGRWASGAPEKCHAGLNALLESQKCLFGKTYLMNRVFKLRRKKQMIECSICYRNRRKITTLQCKHQLCTFCWEKWQKKELEYYMKTLPTCPICRHVQVNPWYHEPWKVCFALILCYVAMLNLPTPAKIPLKL